MDNLKKFIDENRGGFESELLPGGHKIRFGRRLSSLRNRRYMMYISGAAASIIVLVMIPLAAITGGRADTTTALVKKYEKMIDLKVAELHQRASTLDPHNKDVIMSIIDQLTYEAIPFSEQIPAGLNSEEKGTIFDHYYSAKLDGFDTIDAYIGELL